jgi:myo-inositol-1(or 4)-monophosphatase
LPETDIDLLIKAAQASGEIAKTFFQNAPKTWDKDDNAGPVTEADLAVNTYLEDVLRTARPDYGWLSEESLDEPERQSSEYVFIIDPIDGTRSFIEGSRTWAHSLAIARYGRITAAAVLLPMRDMMFSAALDQGALLNGKTLRVSSQKSFERSEILATRPVLEPHHWSKGTAPKFSRHHRPSLAYRLALIAQGRFDAMLTLRPSWEWDIAAGALIVSEAGGTISDKTGTALKFNNVDPRLNGVVAAGPNLHSEIIGKLAAA